MEFCIYSADSRVKLPLSVHTWSGKRLSGSVRLSSNLSCVSLIILCALPSLSLASGLLGNGTSPKSCQSFTHITTLSEGRILHLHPAEHPVSIMEEGNRHLPRDKALRVCLGKQACPSRQDPCTNFDTQATPKVQKKLFKSG